MKETVIQIVYIPISEIHEYENNPRDNDKAVDAVARSIKRYGPRVPAIVDKNNVLIAGHTRIKAAKQLGMTEFPCVRADDLTEGEAKAFRLEDNRTQEESQWDTEALAKEFDGLKNNGFDLLDTGFDSFEIGGIDMSTYDFNAEPEEYDTPEAESGFEELPEDLDNDYDEEEDDPDAEYTVIVSLRDAEEKTFLAEAFGETGELKQRYTVSQIREKLEGGEADEADAGV